MIVLILFFGYECTQLTMFDKLKIYFIRNPYMLKVEQIMTRRKQ